MLAFSIDAWNNSLEAWFAHFGHPLESLMRLTLAAVFGGLVGLEREMRGRQAGFRTYILVCMGSALVMLVSAELAKRPWPLPNPEMQVRIDPGRIAYGVMTGIGFLGAGVIIRNSAGSIRGLTTAAALWCIAAVGLAVGFGMYLVSAFTTALILASLWILDYVEDLLPKVRYRTLTVRTPYHAGCIADAVALFKSAGLDVVDASFQRSEDLKSADISLQIALYKNEQYLRVERKIDNDPDYQLLSTREL